MTTFSNTMRVTTSCTPAAANGTITLIGRTGYVSAMAGPEYRHEHQRNER